MTQLLRRWLYPDLTDNLLFAYDTTRIEVTYSKWCGCPYCRTLTFYHEQEHIGAFEVSGDGLDDAIEHVKESAPQVQILRRDVH